MRDDGPKINLSKRDLSNDFSCLESGGFIVCFVPGQYVPARNTRLASSLHSHTLQVVKCLTSQFQRCFLPRAVRLWNSLAGDTCAAGSMHTFKSKANKNLRSI